MRNVTGSLVLAAVTNKGNNLKTALLLDLTAFPLFSWHIVRKPRFCCIFMIQSFQLTGQLLGTYNARELTWSTTSIKSSLMIQNCHR